MRDLMDFRNNLAYFWQHLVVNDNPSLDMINSAACSAEGRANFLAPVNVPGAVYKRDYKDLSGSLNPHVVGTEISRERVIGFDLIILDREKYLDQVGHLGILGVV